MKSQVLISELIFSLIAIFVAYMVFFPTFMYRPGWPEAQMMLLSRDMLVSLDRSGDFSAVFNPLTFREIKDEIFPPTETLMFWLESDGIVKPGIIVACNCTREQTELLQHWTSDLKMNGRNIVLIFLESNIGPELLDPNNPTDLLLIWGYKDLSKYEKILKEYLRMGRGIVEISDIDPNVDAVTQEIFGIKWNGGGWGSERNNYFFSPSSASSQIYHPYKFFFHFPLPLNTTPVSIIPVEDIAGCPDTNNRKGKFEFRDLSYDFWVCNSTHVYFDTNGNGIADLVVEKGNVFNLTVFNFTITHIENKTIGIRFEEGYEFLNFLGGGTKLEADEERILLHRGRYRDSNTIIPAVVMNASGKVAWSGNFLRNVDAVKDDHRLLLISLLLSASDKSKGRLEGKPLKTGIASSYIYVSNEDVFEVGSISLGIAAPY